MIGDMTVKSSFDWGMLKVELTVLVGGLNKECEQNKGVNHDCKVN